MDYTSGPLPLYQRNNPQEQGKQALRILNSLPEERLRLLAQSLGLLGPDEPRVLLGQEDPARLAHLLKRQAPHLDLSSLEKADPEQVAVALLSLVNDPPDLK
jgi:hypothetical protein